MKFRNRHAYEMNYGDTKRRQASHRKKTDYKRVSNKKLMKDIQAGKEVE